MLFWLMKDVSWMVGSTYTWAVSLTCAVMLSADFIYTTYVTKVRCMYVLYIYVCIYVVGGYVTPTVPTSGSSYIDFGFNMYVYHHVKEFIHTYIHTYIPSYLNDLAYC